MPKVNDLVSESQPQELPLVKTSEVYHISRTLGPMTASENVLSAQDLNAYIGAFLKSGWSLFHVHVLGMSPEGIQMLYVMTR